MDFEVNMAGVNLVRVIKSRSDPLYRIAIVVGLIHPHNFIFDIAGHVVKVFHHMSLSRLRSRAIQVGMHVRGGDRILEVV